MLLEIFQLFSAAMNDLENWSWPLKDIQHTKHLVHGQNKYMCKEIFHWLHTCKN